MKIGSTLFDMQYYLICFTYLYSHFILLSYNTEKKYFYLIIYPCYEKNSIYILTNFIKYLHFFLLIFYMRDARARGVLNLPYGEHTHRMCFIAH